MNTRTKASTFLRAMNPEADIEEASDRKEGSAAPVKAAAKPVDKPAGRIGLKHIGGYFDRETVEMVAVLRARLALDNSALLKLAIEDLHRKHMAKRAYGDA